MNSNVHVTSEANSAPQPNVDAAATTAKGVKVSMDDTTGTATSNSYGNTNTATSASGATKDGATPAAPAHDDCIEHIIL